MVRHLAGEWQGRAWGWGPVSQGALWVLHCRCSGRWQLPSTAEAHPLLPYPQGSSPKKPGPGLPTHSPLFCTHTPTFHLTTAVGLPLTPQLFSLS